MSYNCPLSLRYVVVLTYSQQQQSTTLIIPQLRHCVPFVSWNRRLSQTARAAEPTAGNSASLNQAVNLPESYTIVYSWAYIRDESTPEENQRFLHVDGFHHVDNCSSIKDDDISCLEHHFGYYHNLRDNYCRPAKSSAFGRRSSAFSGF